MLSSVTDDHKGIGGLHLEMLLAPDLSFSASSDRNVRGIKTNDKICS